MEANVANKKHMTDWGCKLRTSQATSHVLQASTSASCISYCRTFTLQMSYGFKHTLSIELWCTRLHTTCCPFYSIASLDQPLNVHHGYPHVDALRSCIPTHNSLYSYAWSNHIGTWPRPFDPSTAVPFEAFLDLSCLVDLLSAVPVIKVAPICESESLTEEAGLTLDIVQPWKHLLQHLAVLCNQDIASHSHILVP